MKDKTVAGILALFLGWLGFHRFYLGQVGLGILYLVFCWFPLIWLIAFIDGIGLLSMDNQRFDEKYNKHSQPAFGGRATEYERRQPQASNRQEEQWQQRKRQEGHQQQRNAPARTNNYKQTGLEKFKDYDYAGAIADFNKSLELDPRDVATHFNLACAYSLMEDASKAFHHLDRAVTNGFKDFQKIKEHHALAYLRIQKEFEAFEINGFRQPARPAAQPESDNLLATEPNLFDRLKKLDELRAKGMLTEQEFVELRRKLES
ncbi:MAG: NINE protein [Bacteroidota bacterium]